MLNVQNNPCLKALSSAVLDPVESFIKRPVIVPSWVASLKEPERSAAIYRCRKYGSPNVLEGFKPHLTVGYDPSTTETSAAAAHLHRREDVMEQWNEDDFGNDGLLLLSQKTKSFIRIKKVTIKQMMIGVIYLRNKNDILRFLAPFRKS